MRRRPRGPDAPGAPPAELLTYTGSTNREALAWVAARMEWWHATHEPEALGDLQWLIDSHDQIGDLRWCGRLTGTCGDDDCGCVVWPEYLERTSRSEAV